MAYGVVKRGFTSFPIDEFTNMSFLFPSQCTVLLFARPRTHLPLQDRTRYLLKSWISITILQRVALKKHRSDSLNELFIISTKYYIHCPSSYQSKS